MERYPETLARLGFSVLAITTAHALAAGALPRHHGDPFDRMLLAQARLEGLTVGHLRRGDGAVRRAAPPRAPLTAPLR